MPRRRGNQQKGRDSRCGVLTSRISSSLAMFNKVSLVYELTTKVNDTYTAGCHRKVDSTYTIQRNEDRSHTVRGSGAPGDKEAKMGRELVVYFVWVVSKFPASRQTR